MDSLFVLCVVTVFTLSKSSCNPLEMYNVTIKILKTCDLTSHNKVLENMILSTDCKLTECQISWPYTFSNLISTNYLASLDGKYLTIFRSDDLSRALALDFQFIVFTHWMISKLNRASKSLLDSSTSAEIVCIIMKSIKWNHPYRFSDILEPLWNNFVAPALFEKLSNAINHVHDTNYLKSLCYLNQIIGSYFSVFCTDAEGIQYFMKLVENETKQFRFLVPQYIFYGIIASHGLFDNETQRRYFEIWLNDHQMMPINQVLDVINEPLGYEACKNSVIVTKFMCSLIEDDANHTSEIYHYLHCALVKDRTLLNQAKSRRNRAPSYGYYVTVDVIKAIEQKEFHCLERNEWRKFTIAVYYSCKMFGRNDLVKYLKSNKTRDKYERRIDICIPCAVKEQG